MAFKTIVVAPHPDDELLGVGGTALRRKAEGGCVAWLLFTSIGTEHGWAAEKVAQRRREIAAVKEAIGFDELIELDLPTTQLDRVPMSDLVTQVSNVFAGFAPDEVFLPHPSDIHSDHRAVFDAVASCTKWFRYPSVKRVLAYETLSETEFAMGNVPCFHPNVFVDIEAFLDAKLSAMEIYASEMHPFPFPRSATAVQALATLRGAASGFKAAEAFELLRERS